MSKPFATVMLLSSLPVSYSHTLPRPFPFLNFYVRNIKCNTSTPKMTENHASQFGQPCHLQTWILETPKVPVLFFSLLIIIKLSPRQKKTVLEPLDTRSLRNVTLFFQ